MTPENRGSTRIVLDTNVVVAALFWQGPPYRLLQAARASAHLQLFSSRPLIDELARVLARPKQARGLATLGRSADEVVAAYEQAVCLVTPQAVPAIVAADPDDDAVLAAAVAAKAHILVSGDRHLLALGVHQAIEIVTPAAALAWVET